MLDGDLASHFQFSLQSVIEGDDPAIGRCLGSQGISAVITRAQNAVVAKGYVTTRILAAPQDLNGGELTLTVIPGRINSIRFSADSDARATQWNALPANPGDLLNLRDIEQGLENFKRVPTADADIQITPADTNRPGDSDLVIQWKQAFPFRISASIDDAGSKSTGKYQGSVTLSYDHWWTLNDLFYVSTNRDLGGGDPGRRGTDGTVVHYSIPIGYWLLGATYSQSQYEQSVAGLNQTYLYSGDNDSAEVKLSRLVYRDAVRKTTVSLGGWTRSSSNFIDDTEVEVQRRRMAGWSAGIAHREFIGDAIFDLSLGYKRGTGAFDALPAQEERFGEGTSRSGVVTTDLQFNLPFTLGAQRLRYTGNWRAQWNRTPLVPQDRFAIGSRYTVRGFDGENQLIADRGWLIRNDLSMTLGDTEQELYLGVDAGAVSGPSSAALIGKRLSGAVLGLRGNLNHWSYDVFVGTPLSKPEGFQSASSVAGFTVSWSY